MDELLLLLRPGRLQKLHEIADRGKSNPHDLVLELIDVFIAKTERPDDPTIDLSKLPLLPR